MELDFAGDFTLQAAVVDELATAVRPRVNFQ